MAEAQSDSHRSAPLWARGPVWLATGALALVLAVFSNGYGFHRDELYFRTLAPAWGYVDQPPLTPLIGRTLGGLSTDPWVLRLAAIAIATGAVWIVVGICRELGGGRAAQTLCAWGYGFAAFPLAFGHVLLTATLDLVFWPLAALAVIRAVLRDPRWWIAAGAVVGVATYNKLLIALLIVAVVVGMVAVGPRKPLASKWFWLGVAVAVLIALPNLLYQATHGWPQFQMAQALAEQNADDVRPMLVPFLFLLLGPPQALVCAVGLWKLLTRPDWRPLRWLAPALLAVVVMSLVGGGQLYYPLGLLTVVFAVGCIPVAQWADRRARRLVVATLVAVNAVISLLISLPLVPVGVLASTPIPGINSSVPDMVGWPQYTAQVRAVYRQAQAADPSTIVITTNYGEYGALATFGPAEWAGRLYSGHNALGLQATPPPVNTVVVVGDQLDKLEPLFATCEVKALLDNGYDVDNEEQQQPVAICVDPVRPLPQVWDQVRHLG